VKQNDKQKIKQEEKLKTIKFRLFPNEEEKKQLQLQFEQFRWYYNSTLTIFYKYYGSDNILKKNKYSNYTVRDILTQVKI
jgi:transposase